MDQKNKNKSGAKPHTNQSKAQSASAKPQTKSQAQAQGADKQDDFEKKVERAIHAEKREKSEADDKKDAKKKIVTDKKSKERDAKKRARLRAIEAKRKAKAEKHAAVHAAHAAKLEENKKKHAAKMEAKRKRANAKTRKGGAASEEKIRLREAKLAEQHRLHEVKLEAKKKKKELRLENKRRRHAKHARFKHASATERKRMIAEIKAERTRKKQARAEDAKLRKLERKKEKLARREQREEADRARKEHRDANRQNRRGEPVFRTRRHVAMFCALCSVFAVFTGLLTFSTVYFSRQKDEMTQQLNNMYERNFFDLMENMNNLSVKLSKLMISTGDDTEKYLIEVVRQSDATANNLASVPVAEESILNTMKFVNQLGDFCNYLTNKMTRGGALSDEDVANIERLYDTNMLLYAQMNMFYMQVVAGYRFTDNLNGDMFYDNPMSDSFNEIQNGSIEYPKLIYDGPFSESVTNAEFKGLTGDEVSRETAQEKLAGYLGGMDVRSIVFDSETDSKCATYNFTADVGGNTMFAQVSKIGGHLILLTNYRMLDNFELSVEQCVEKAEEYVSSLGYENMQAVWSSDYNGNVYVNLIVEKDGVLVYPDMIKVEVARDNGEILGFDSMTYYMNHTDEREIGKAGMTAIKVRQKISSKLDIESEKLVVVPTDGGKESLCYEFYGSYRDMLYFVYADANTGKEINVYRVIDSESGSLVM